MASSLTPKGPGRPQKTTSGRWQNSFPFTTSSKVKNTLQEVCISLSISTIKRCLHACKYREGHNFLSYFWEQSLLSCTPAREYTLHGLAHALTRWSPKMVELRMTTLMAHYRPDNMAYVPVSLTPSQVTWRWDCFRLLCNYYFQGQEWNFDSKS